MTSWVTAAFGEWYSTVYSHRNDEEAALLIRTLGREVDLSGTKILDVACGAGRHLQNLEATGGRPVGLDFSAVMLDEGRRTRREVGGAWPLVRGDMRELPFRDGMFAGATNLFTSFGYFSEDEDRQILSGCARVLRPGGFFLLDFLNRDFVIAHHNPQSERTTGAHRIVERRRFTAGQRRAVKRITVTATRGGERLADYEERVTLYRDEELRALLRESGFTIRREWGSYDGASFVPAESSRHIFLSFKEPA